MGQCMKKMIDPQGPEELLTFFEHLRGHAKVPGNRSDFLQHCQHRLTRCILLEAIVAKRMMRKFPKHIPPKFKNLCRMYCNIKVTSKYVDNRVFIGDEVEVRLTTWSGFTGKGDGLRRFREHQIESSIIV